MKSILEKLYHGRISPWERRTGRSEERRELERKIENEKRYFIQKMSLDDCQRFQEMENLYGQASSVSEVEVFTLGFRLAALMMIEIFSEDERKE